MLCNGDIQEWQISKFYKQKDYDDDCYNILLNTNDINGDII